MCVCVWGGGGGEYYLFEVEKQKYCVVNVE